MELVHFGGEAGWIMLYASSDLAIPLQTITKRDFALLGCRLMVNRIHKPREFVSLQSHAHAMCMCVCMLERERMDPSRFDLEYKQFMRLLEMAPHRKLHPQPSALEGLLGIQAEMCTTTLQWKHAENSKLYVNAHPIKLNSFDKNTARFLC